MTNLEEIVAILRDVDEDEFESEIKAAIKATCDIFLKKLFDNQKTIQLIVLAKSNLPEYLYSKIIRHYVNEGLNDFFNEESRKISISVKNLADKVMDIIFGEMDQSDSDYSEDKAPDNAEDCDRKTSDES